ncbi:MAG: SH3 domain-containing protein [Dehalococcoidia bacterium]|nr:SH3 domain-containing protein [Dehalococcoidia bacterium]
MFDLSATGALARIAGPDPTPTGWAIQDFGLREAPRMDSGRVATIKAASRLRLIDSAGGEILNPKADSPAKWYLVRAEGGEIGWAYSQWVRR